MQLSRIYSRWVVGTVVLITLFFPTASANALLPFGGQINYIFYNCNSGQFIEIGAPGIFNSGSAYLMYTSGTESYEYAPPEYASQKLLGQASSPMPCLYECGPYTCVYGVGFVISYHGASLY